MGTLSNFEHIQDQDMLQELLDKERFRIFPLYGRLGGKKVQKADFSAFFKTLDETYLEVMQLMARVDSALLKNRLQKIIDTILFQKKVYEKKVVYTVQTNDRPFKKSLPFAAWDAGLS